MRESLPHELPESFPERFETKQIWYLSAKKSVAPSRCSSCMVPKPKECLNLQWTFRSVSGTSARSKMELLITKINGLKPLALVTKESILDFVRVVDAPLRFVFFCWLFTFIFDSMLLAFCHEKSLGEYFDRPVMLLLHGSGIADLLKKIYRLL